MLQESGDMMMIITDGSIPVAGHQNSRVGTAGSVIRGLLQGIQGSTEALAGIPCSEDRGGWYTIGSLMFTTKEESVAYCLRHASQ